MSRGEHKNEASIIALMQTAVFFPLGMDTILSVDPSVP